MNGKLEVETTKAKKEIVNRKHDQNQINRERHMAIQLTEKNGGKVLEVQVSGKLDHEEYKHFVPEFERLVKQHGKIRVLFEMADFHGWEGAALWTTSSST